MGCVVKYSMWGVLVGGPKIIFGGVIIENVKLFNSCVYSIIKKYIYFKLYRMYVRYKRFSNIVRVFTKCPG